MNQNQTTRFGKSGPSTAEFWVAVKPLIQQAVTHKLARTSGRSFFAGPLPSAIYQKSEIQKKSEAPPKPKSAGLCWSSSSLFQNGKKLISEFRFRTPFGFRGFGLRISGFIMSDKRTIAGLISFGDYQVQNSQIRLQN
jgi:hypothetical protein